MNPRNLAVLATCLASAMFAIPPTSAAQIQVLVPTVVPTAETLVLQDDAQSTPAPEVVPTPPGELPAPSPPDEPVVDEPPRLLRCLFLQRLRERRMNRRSVRTSRRTVEVDIGTGNVDVQRTRRFERTRTRTEGPAE